MCNLGGLAMEKNKHSHDEESWYAHKVVCAYYDAGVKPTVAELRANWRANYYANESDEWLGELIERIGKFYK